MRMLVLQQGLLGTQNALFGDEADAIKPSEVKVREAAEGKLDLLTVLGWGGTGDEPSTLSLVIAVPFVVLFIALVVELGFRRGTRGVNPHGPDPLAKS